MATCLALLAVGAAAAPAAAGGILPALSPAFGTTCANHGTARAGAATTHSTGTAGGNAAAPPIGDALNHCGGAELGGNLGGLGALPPPLAPGGVGEGG
ncbi:hypothetical protein [Streptomyces sp. NPDC007100]|uniref:hypothetical protein n=1 Tax=Streptomyces sp. NPDC007100 TaxID=3155602 RepID=UPI0033D0AC8E